MNTKLKKAFFVIISLVILIFLGFFGLNYFIENKLKEQINKAPENVNIQYESIQVNLLKGSVRLIKPSIILYERSTQIINTQIEMVNFSVAGFSYWNYFFKDKIMLDNVLFSEPKITYYKNGEAKSETKKDGFENGLKHIIKIERIKIKDAYVQVFDISKDTIILASEGVNFKMDVIEINPSAEKNSISYKNFKVTTATTFYCLNDYENMVVEKLDISSDGSKFKGVNVKTKYSKEVLLNKIKTERDHFDITIDSIEIKNQNFGFKKDTTCYFSSDCVVLFQPNVKIFRDKLVADNLIKKPLCSEVIRQLNFNLMLNSVFINNASITYTEKTKANTQGGKISFTKFNAEINNLGNTYKLNEKVTKVNLTAIFMGNTPMKMRISFDINNVKDEFIIKAQMGKLNTVSMNQFMKPNLNVYLKGQINKAYFTIIGNNKTSNINLKLKYDDFDMAVLKDNGHEKNKFLSIIANIFVSNDSKDVSNYFRHGSKSNVERAMNKSFFNYIWLNVKAGLIDAMTSDGKEK